MVRGQRSWPQKHLPKYSKHIFINIFVFAVKLEILTWRCMKIDSLWIQPLVDTGGAAAFSFISPRHVLQAEFKDQFSLSLLVSSRLRGLRVLLVLNQV